MWELIQVAKEALNTTNATDTDAINTIDDEQWGPGWKMVMSHVSYSLFREWIQIGWLLTYTAAVIFM